MFEGSVSKNRHLMIDVITLNHTVRCSRNSGRDCAARFYSSPPTHKRRRWQHPVCGSGSEKESAECRDRSVDVKGEGRINRSAQGILA